jgi:hypothetical protein
MLTAKFQAVLCRFCADGVALLTIAQTLPHFRAEMHCMSHVIAPFRGIRYIPPFLYCHSNGRVVPLVNTPESMCVDLLSTWGAAKVRCGKPGISQAIRRRELRSSYDFRRGGAPHWRFG